MHGRNSHKHNYARMPWKNALIMTTLPYKKKLIKNKKKTLKKKIQTTQRRKGFRREQSSIQQCYV